MREPYRTALCMITLFYGNNDIVVDSVKTSENPGDDVPSFGIDVIAGLEADLFESTSQREFDPNWGSGEFSKRYINAADLSSLLNCTAQTARNRLKEFEKHGIIQEEGEMGSEVGNIRLYRPVLDDAKEFMSTIDELVGNNISGNEDDLQEVTPSDFDHVRGGEWLYKRDDSVVIDVSDPEHGTIKSHIEGQLEEHGLKPSISKNFQYELRNQSGQL